MEFDYFHILSRDIFTMRGNVNMLILGHPVYT